MLNNIKKTDRGFTIVELLIVIVVIAILAAISIVAYNGIQNRGKASSGQSLASQIAKKAEAFNTIQSSYPGNVAAFSATGAPDEAKLDDASKVTDYSTTAGNAGDTTVAANYSDGNKVIYRYCAATTSPVKSAGGVVYWWDFAASPAAAKQISIGGGC